jgi:hypothetical protein
VATSPAILPDHPRTWRHRHLLSGRDLNALLAAGVQVNLHRISRIHRYGRRPPRDLVPPMPKENAAYVTGASSG